MRRIIASGLLVTGMLACIGTASAHHSFTAEFDRNKKVSLKGIVTKVEWTNPHVWIYLNVKDENGNVTNWGAEMGPPHGLQSRGWRRNTLEIGTAVTIDGSMAKNGTSRINASTVTLSATGGRPGEKLDAASSGNSSKDGN